MAIDVVRSFPARVAAHPERFAVSADGIAAPALDDILRREAAERRFAYTRSDGAAWTLTLADVLERSEALELAYNPNDCPEIRWGAPEGSEERSTCRRRAPAEQQARMARYRVWFHTRTRPPR
jgi:hypothetical protein